MKSQRLRDILAALADICGVLSFIGITIYSAKILGEGGLFDNPALINSVIDFLGTSSVSLIAIFLMYWFLMGIRQPFGHCVIVQHSIPAFYIIVYSLTALVTLPLSMFLSFAWILLTMSLLGMLLGSPWKAGLTFPVLFLYWLPFVFVSGFLRYESAKSMGSTASIGSVAWKILCAVYSVVGAALLVGWIGSLLSSMS